MTFALSHTLWDGCHRLSPWRPICYHGSRVVSTAWPGGGGQIAMEKANEDWVTVFFSLVWDCSVLLSGSDKGLWNY